MEDKYIFVDEICVGPIYKNAALFKRNETGLYHICSFNERIKEDMNDAILQDLSKKLNVDIEILFKAYQERERH